MKILVSAGEVSGDLYGSSLVKEIKKMRPDSVFFGMGGEKLAAEGMDVHFDIISRSSVGLVETLPNVIPIYLVFRKMLRLMKKEKPDLLIAIDCQGFNVPLIKEAKKRGIKRVYFIPPQEWLWGNDKNLKIVADNASLLACIFEEEVKAYKKAGGNAVYFGHPILDIARPVLSKEEFITKHSLKNDFPIISLGLGSRKQEFKTLLPKIIETAKIISLEFKEAQFIIPLSNPRFRKIVESCLRKSSFPAKIIDDSSYNILASSDLLITKSGTINLEASVLGIPNIMIYEINPFTYFLADKVLKIRVPPFFSLPNIIAKEKIIPEFVQKDVIPVKIAEEAVKILNSPNELKSKMQKVRAALGNPGATAQIASSILSL